MCLTPTCSRTPTGLSATVFETFVAPVVFAKFLSRLAMRCMGIRKGALVARKQIRPRINGVVEKAHRNSRRVMPHKSPQFLHYALCSPKFYSPPLAARFIAPSASLKKEPSAPLRLVDPNFDQTRARHVPMLVADPVRLAHGCGQLLIVVA
jgi:hypothetical protein